MTRPKVFIATPSHDHKVHASFAWSLLQLQKAGLYPLTFSKVGGAGVARARNNQAHEFLTGTDCDLFFPIDCDIEFTPEEFARIIEHGRENVGAPYALKQNDLAWCIDPIRGEVPDPKTGLQKVKSSGTGFKCIHRCVFERMIKAHPEIEYVEDMNGERGKVRWDFFSMGVVNRRYLSEDWYFDHRHRALGGEVFVDMTFYVKHEGLISYPLKSPLDEQPRWPAEYLAAGIAPNHCGDVLDGCYDVPFNPEKPPVILDIGANIGAFASWASVRWPSCKLYCYEPDPENFALLLKTADAITAETKSSVESFSLAVLDRNSVMPLYHGAHNCGEHSLFDNGEQTSELVYVSVIDARHLPAADILKLDTEGAELPILRQLHECGRLGETNAVMLEYHSKADRVAIGELMDRAGFLLHEHRPHCTDRGEMKFLNSRAAQLAA